MRLTAALAVGLLGLALAPAALAKRHSSVVITGSSSNTQGQPFTETMSGYAASPADEVVAGEQNTAGVPCSSKYTTERTRSNFAPIRSVRVAKNHSFSGLTINYNANALGKHAQCAYVISTRTGKTYAHAEKTWTNVAASGPSPGTTPAGGKLQPTPVGEGQCQARSYPDNSVTAQIAISGPATCGDAGAVEPGADTAKGAPFTSDGYSCSATQEGPGSTWSSSWGGTYYAYSCAHGAGQVAFNWGTDYTYGQ